MKRVILQPLVFILSLLAAGSASAQITITATDLSRPSSFIDTIGTIDAVIPPPSNGAAQFWDYSSLVPDGVYADPYTDATADPVFLDATHVTPNQLTFQAFSAPIDVYETMDSDGFYTTGVQVNQASFSIAAISGGPNDTLRFINTPVVYSERVDEIRFPLDYNDFWTSNRVELFNFELDVAAFGLVNTPGYRKRFSTNSYVVTSYGQLVIPMYDGSPSQPMDVLLVNEYISYVDSFFLAGAPAPAALLTAFGLTQGDFSAKETEIFYTPGLGVPVLSISLSGDQSTYHALSTNLSTAINDIYLPTLTSFPNPIQAGNVLTINIENHESEGQISIYDLTGRIMSQENYNSFDGQIQITVPSNLNSGVYFYQLANKDGDLVGREKIIIN